MMGIKLWTKYSVFYASKRPQISHSSLHSPKNQKWRTQIYTELIAILLANPQNIKNNFLFYFWHFHWKFFFSLLFLLLSTRWKTKTIKMLSGLHFNVISFYLMCVKRFFLFFSFWMFQISLRTSTHLLVCMYVCVCAAR